MRNPTMEDKYKSSYSDHSRTDPRKYQQKPAQQEDDEFERQGDYF